MQREKTASMQHTKQLGNGTQLGSRKKTTIEGNVSPEDVSPISIRQERTRFSHDNSLRRREEGHSGSPFSSRGYSKGSSDRVPSGENFARSSHRKDSHTPGARPSSFRYKSSSPGKTDPDSPRAGLGSSRGNTVGRDGLASSRIPSRRSSNARVQSGNFSNYSSSGASSTTNTPQSVKKLPGKSGNRKLDAKVFALSMELIEHVSKGRLELAEKKIKQGASPDYADYDKRTPLHLAASEGHIDVVKMLLEYGANPEVEDRWGSKPYDEAVKHKFTEIVDVLRHYCQPDDEDTLSKDHHDGLELLEYSARGFERLVREKIAGGTKPTFADYDLRTPLHLAACEGHAKIVDILLNNGADATFKDRFGNTAVDDAMHNGFLKVLGVMKKRGVELPTHIFDKSHTPEFQRNMQLIDVCARGKIGMAHKLLQAGADAKFSDYDLRTPLHLACAEGHVSIVRVLISAGADISAEDRWAATPFEEAMKYEHEDVIEFLEGSARTGSSVTTME